MSEDESPLKVFDRYVHSIAKTDDRAAPFSHEPRKAIIAMIDEMATLKEKERARSQIIDAARIAQETERKISEDYKTKWHVAIGEIERLKDLVEKYKADAVGARADAMLNRH